MKKIFILGASALQVPAIKKAKEKGLYVYALDYDPEAVGIKEADEFLCISTIDKEAVLEAAKEKNPDYIITSTSDMPVRTVSWVNEQLGRKNDISFENAICATDKAAMRRRMKECGVPIPKFYEIFNERDFIEAVGKLGDRFVCKPADNAASRGVVLVDQKEIALKAGKDIEVELLKIYEYTKEYSRSGEVLLEEFMEGPEVSVESFTVNGETHIITITDKMVTEIPFFVETGHTEPSRLPSDVKEDIMRVAEAAIKAVGIENGPSHTEIKITKDGAKLVEIAARLGGDFITSKLVPLSTGVDLIDCCLSSTLNEEVKWQSEKNCGSAIRFLFAKEADNFDEKKNGDDLIISGIEGVEEASKMPGVIEVIIYKKTGDKATKLTNSGDRWGHVIAEGKDADDAAKKAEAATAKIRFIIS
ncbi:MAG: ATP-grasp domain-containing protein [Lachnospiraceae bacterium]|nr:ATP-grasp domain-containing protein [Lachnospiraceae bacterium]